VKDSGVEARPAKRVSKKPEHVDHEGTSFIPERGFFVAFERAASTDDTIATRL